jgi:hypothetical protein
MIFAVRQDTIHVRKRQISSFSFPWVLIGMKSGGRRHPRFGLLSFKQRKVVWVRYLWWWKSVLRASGLFGLSLKAQSDPIYQAQHYYKLIH